jgi:hypothetical protein
LSESKGAINDNTAEQNDLKASRRYHVVANPSASMFRNHPGNKIRFPASHGSALARQIFRAWDNAPTRQLYYAIVFWWVIIVPFILLPSLARMKNIV